MNMPCNVYGAPADGHTLCGPLFSRLDIPVPIASLQGEVSQLMAGDWLPHVNRGGYDGVWV